LFIGLLQILVGSQLLKQNMQLSCKLLLDKKLKTDYTTKNAHGKKDTSIHLILRNSIVLTVPQPLIQPEQNSPFATAKNLMDIHV